MRVAFGYITYRQEWAAVGIWTDAKIDAERQERKVVITPWQRWWAWFPCWCKGVGPRWLIYVARREIDSSFLGGPGEWGYEYVTWPEAVRQKLMREAE